MNLTTIERLDQDISGLSSRPKGIKVGTGLWRALNKADRIRPERGYIAGVIDTGIDYPVLDENIFVDIDSNLEDEGYIIPQDT